MRTLCIEFPFIIYPLDVVVEQGVTMVTHNTNIKNNYLRNHHLG